MLGAPASPRTCRARTAPPTSSLGPDRMRARPMPQAARPPFPTSPVATRRTAAATGPRTWYNGHAHESDTTRGLYIWKVSDSAPRVCDEARGGAGPATARRWLGPAAVRARRARRTAAGWERRRRPRGRSDSGATGSVVDFYNGSGEPALDRARPRRRRRSKGRSDLCTGRLGAVRGKPSCPTVDQRQQGRTEPHWRFPTRARPRRRRRGRGGGGVPGTPRNERTGHGGSRGNA